MLPRFLQRTLLTMSERIAVYPGTFDPITNGHMDMIRRSSAMFDRLIVGVAENIDKDPLFTLEERLEMVRNETKDMPTVEVVPFKSLLIHFAREENAYFIVRGLRAVSDFEYEFKMCVMNSRLDPEIETVFLMASEQSQFISSLFVKEVSRMGGDISSFVSKAVHDRLKKQYKEMQ